MRDFVDQIRQVLATAILGIVLCGSGHAETVVGFTDEWCPYVCEPEPNRPGILIEITHTAFEGVGVFTPLSPANPEKSKRLAGLIDKTVKAFESDGRLERLLEKYVVKRDQ
tara:strand:- start:371 stop:703 length:333 start_codon:yes stop_codon:yes gene_type:complete